jgi:hypothetical protein
VKSVHARWPCMGRYAVWLEQTERQGHAGSDSVQVCSVV